jgi:hypothetical protein
LPGCEEHAARALGRATARYFLRTLELLQPHFPALTQAFIVLALATGDRRDDPAAGAPLAGCARTAAYRPAKVSDLAVRLSLPQETVRRQLLRLVDAGCCRRVTAGYLLALEGAARSTLTTMAAENARNLKRLFAELAGATSLNSLVPAAGLSSCRGRR